MDYYYKCTLQRVKKMNQREEKSVTKRYLFLIQNTIVEFGEAYVGQKIFIMNSGEIKVQQKFHSVSSALLLAINKKAQLSCYFVVFKSHHPNCIPVHFNERNTVAYLKQMQQRTTFLSATLFKMLLSATFQFAPNLKQTQ